MYKRLVLLNLFCWLISTAGFGQNNAQQFVIYPADAGKKWQAAYGLSFMTTPRAITEEFHRRIPAGELIALKKLAGGLYLNPRLRFQFIQNEFILNAGYILCNKEKWGMAAECGGSIWAGILKAEAFDRKSYGFMCYPSIKGGYKLRKDLLLTIKFEALLNLKRFDIAGKISQSIPSPLYSGEAASFYIEQPFFKKTSIILGFRAMYCDFYWQTWSLIETFEGKIFYPEVLIELML